MAENLFFILKYELIKVGSWQLWVERGGKTVIEKEIYFERYIHGFFFITSVLVGGKKRLLKS